MDKDLLGLIPFIGSVGVAVIGLIVCVFTALICDCCWKRGRCLGFLQFLTEECPCPGLPESPSPHSRFHMSTNRPSTNYPPTNSPLIHRSLADNPPTHSSPADNPPADNPPADNPPADNPPADNPPADNPPTNSPPANSPPASNPQSRLIYVKPAETRIEGHKNEGYSEEHDDGASEKPRERKKNRKPNERAASAPNRQGQRRCKRGEGSDSDGPVTRSHKGRKGSL